MNTKTKNIQIIDSTLRDGSHAIGHQFTKEQIRSYAQGAEKAGTKIIIVGHGNGLGASSLHLGQSLLSDTQMLKIAKKELKNTHLGAFLIPGYGTIKNDIQPAIDVGIDVLMVACHSTEANITRQHISYAVFHKIRVFGILMMSHMVNAKELLNQAKLMENYEVEGVILMDSAGSYLPNDVKKKITILANNLSVKVGFHAHNNLGLAISNSLTAIDCGADIIDTTSRGLGAGAGNCQLEVLAAVLEKQGVHTGLNLNILLDNSENIIAKIMKKPIVINEVTLLSGINGIFSGFAPHAVKAAARFDVDVREIFKELGKRKVVAGQEDIIIDVAMYLKQQKEENQKNFQIASLS